MRGDKDIKLTSSYIEKLSDIRLLKKIMCFYETGRLTVMNSKAHYWEVLNQFNIFHTFKPPFLQYHFFINLSPIYA
jgi:hypothetical protein